MSREVMQQALDALQIYSTASHKIQDAIKALKAELSKPEQELPTLRQVVIESALKGYAKPEQAEQIEPEDWKHHRHFHEQQLAKPEQEPVSHLWECLGRWSSYLAVNGEQGNLAPPTWLVDAVKVATAPPRKDWVGLTEHEIWECQKPGLSDDVYKLIEAKLKEKNT
jgi:Arc/MetJ-type ribon-helix-helix transcriptional regulator